MISGNYPYFFLRGNRDTQKNIIELPDPADTKNRIILIQEEDQILICSVNIGERKIKDGFFHTKEEKTP